MQRPTKSAKKPARRRLLLSLHFGLGLLLHTDLPAAESNPRLLGSWTPNGGATDVVQVGNLTYLVGDDFSIDPGLKILETSDPANPVRIGGLALAGVPERIELLGSYAYITARRGGLHVVDVSDPTTPRRTGGVAASSFIHDVAFAGDYAFVAAEAAGLHVLSITNRASPNRLATFFASSLAPVYGVCVSSNVAFVLKVSYSDATWNQGLVYVVDITDPRTPVKLSEYQTSGGLTRGIVAGNYLYLTKFVLNRDRTWWGGALEIVDVRDPKRPQLVSAYQTTGLAYDVVVSGDRAYVACREDASEQGPSQTGGFNADRGLNVIDVSDPAHPRRVAGYQSSWLEGIAVVGERVYGAGPYVGLQIIDLSPPADLVRVASLKTIEHECGLAQSANQLLVADRLGGLQVIDVSNPLRPTLTATVASVEPVWGVAVSGSTAYAATGASGLQLFDVRDPMSPRLLGVYDTPGQARGVALSGAYAYIADGDAGLQVVDISDPSNPLLVGSLDTPGFAAGVCVMGNHILLADWQNGLLVIDVNDPQDPQVVGNYSTGGYTLCVAVSGSNAFVGDDIGGFQILDLSNPASPNLVGSAPSDGWARSICVSGRYAYVADAFSGVQVYDIGDLAHPQKAGGTAAVDGYGLLVVGDRLFVAGGKDGLGVFDLFQPSVSQPEIKANRSGDSLLISWPAAFTGAILETTSQLRPMPTWSKEPTAPTRLGDQNVVTLEIGSGQRFFRLRKP